MKTKAIRIPKMTAESKVRRSKKFKSNQEFGDLRKLFLNLFIHDHKFYDHLFILIHFTKVSFLDACFDILGDFLRFDST